MILWDPAGHFCSGWVDNSLEDGSLSFRVDSSNFAQQGVEFCDKVHDLFEMTETLYTLEDLVKHWFLFISAERSFRLFYKTDVRLSRPQPHRAGQLRVIQRISTVSGELTQFLVQIVMCGVQLRLRQGGLVSASEKRREYSKLRIR